MGTVKVRLQGEKLDEEYALVKMKSGKMEGNWLLIKMDDDEADAQRNPTNTQNKSRMSGRSSKEIEK